MWVPMQKKRTATGCRTGAGEQGERETAHVSLVYMRNQPIATRTSGDQDARFSPAQLARQPASEKRIFCNTTQTPDKAEKGEKVKRRESGRRGCKEGFILSPISD